MAKLQSLLQSQKLVRSDSTSSEDYINIELVIGIMVENKKIGVALFITRNCMSFDDQLLQDASFLFLNMLLCD